MAKQVPQVGHYKVNYRLVDKTSESANFIRDRNPQRPVKKADKKSPSPVSYLVDKKDERNIISQKKKSLAFSIGSPDRDKNPKLQRFVDIHSKNKAWMPPLTKYNFTAEQKNKYIS